MRARTISVSVGCPPASVYEFVSDPGNLPKWARAFALAAQRTDVGWVVQTPRGPAAVRFAKKNDFYVLDHYVTPEAGDTVYVPMRVVANGAGSEVVFTLFQQPDVTDPQFEAEVKMAEGDLRSLKNIFEKTCSAART